MSTEIAKKPPTFTDLMSNEEEAFKNDELNFLLNRAPHPTWIKKHPLAKMKDSEGREVPLDYLPIDKVEYLLTKIFKRWRVEVLEVQQLFNAVQVTRPPRITIAIGCSISRPGAPFSIAINQCFIKIAREPFRCSVNGSLNSPRHSLD